MNEGRGGSEEEPIRKLVTAGGSNFPVSSQTNSVSSVMMLKKMDSSGSLTRLPVARLTTWMTGWLGGSS